MRETFFRSAATLFWVLETAFGLPHVMFRVTTFFGSVFFFLAARTGGVAGASATDFCAPARLKNAKSVRTWGSLDIAIFYKTKNVYHHDDMRTRAHTLFCTEHTFFALFGLQSPPFRVL